MELIPCVDLILQMEPIPVVELIPVNDMIPTFMILIPTYPHCGIGDSNSNSKKYWNHNTSTIEGIASWHKTSSSKPVASSQIKETFVHRARIPRAPKRQKQAPNVQER